MSTPISPDAGNGGCDRRGGVHTALEQPALRPPEAGPRPRQSRETLARDSVAIATARVKPGRHVVGAFAPAVVVAALAGSLAVAAFAEAAHLVRHLLSRPQGQARGQGAVVQL